MPFHSIGCTGLFYTAPMSTHGDWNASEYHRVSDVQFRWGLQVLSELQLQGDEVVIDAGCGTGRLTSVLLERLTTGRVVALDASEAMLEVARRELERFGDRVACSQADLAALTLHSVADVIFSNATFHWVTDHDALFKSLRRALKTGGRLHAQCGGIGNLAHFQKLALGVGHEKPFTEYFANFVSPTNFADEASTLARLEAAGFHDQRVWLSLAPTPFETRDDFKAFINTVVLRHAAAVMPASLHAQFLDTVVDRCAARPEGLSLDYVRLNIRAVAG